MCDPRRSRGYASRGTAWVTTLRAVKIVLLGAAIVQFRRTG